jgi:hypothetical protein
MSRANWGKAKLIVSALRSEIENLFSEDLNLEEIYQRLSADGKINIGKSTFKRHASDIIKDTRTLTLKRLLNEEIITPNEFKTRIKSRLGALASPSSQPLASLSSDQPRPKARYIWPSPNSTPSQTPHPKQSIQTTPSPARSFGHKGDGATPDFLQDVYGGTQPKPYQEEDPNE